MQPVVQTDDMPNEKSQPLYSLPKPTDNVKAERSRLDRQHEMFRIATGANSHAPTDKNLQRVLDIGCGTGIWSEAFALAHPHAHVLGVDLEPPLEVSRSRPFPANCSFLKLNFEDDWDVLDSYGPFDYIHARLLILGVREWPRLFRQVFRYLRPGGYFETFEGNVQVETSIDCPTQEMPAIRWYDMLRKYMQSLGLNPSAVLDFTSQLEAAGFHVLVDRTYKTHLNPKQSNLEDPEESQYVASFQLQNWVDLVERMTPKVFGSSEEAARDGHQLSIDAIDDLKRNGASHEYFVRFMLRVAQKPQIQSD